MKKVLSYGSQFALPVVAYLSAVEDVGWLANVFLFFTWAAFGIRLLTIGSNKVEEVLIASYQSGDHAVEWFDHVTYFFTCAILASQKWWVIATVWLVKWMLDYDMRNKAKKEELP